MEINSSKLFMESKAKKWFHTSELSQNTYKIENMVFTLRFCEHACQDVGFLGVMLYCKLTWQSHDHY